MKKRYSLPSLYARLYSAVLHGRQSQFLKLTRIGILGDTVWVVVLLAGLVAGSYLNRPTTQKITASSSLVSLESIAAREYLPTIQSTDAKHNAFTHRTAHLVNRAQNLRAYISSRGYEISSRIVDESQPWKMNLILTGLGRKNNRESQQVFSSQTAADPVIDPKEPIVSIMHPGIEEWFVNTKAGIRQNFLVENRPEGSGEVTLSVAVRSDLDVYAQTPDTISFGAYGRTILQYSQLRVTDANNKVLPGRMKITPKAKGEYQLALVFDDTDAVYPVLVDPLTSTSATTLNMSQTDAAFGAKVFIANVNGDSYSDAIVGAPTYDNGNTDEGAVFVFFGSALGVSATPDVTLEGNQDGAAFGSAISGGDYSNDGISDIVVGAPYYDNGQNDEGAVFVFYGSAGVISTTPDLTRENDLDTSSFGFSIFSVNDLNADGYHDMIIGAPNYSVGHIDEGAVYVYYGSISGIAASADVTLESNLDDAQMGYSVADGSFLNNDAYHDIIAGAPVYSNGETNEGAAYIFYGAVSSYPAVADVILESNQASAEFGRAVAAANTNGGLYSEVIVGAPLYDNGESDEGVAFIYNGSAAGVSTSPDVTLQSNQATAGYGWAVATAGDTNGDTYDDVLVGARLYDNGESDEGAAFLYLGSASGVSTTADITMESNQASSFFGTAISSGDITGDSYPDAIVGASLYNAGTATEGAAFVYHNTGAGVGLTVTESDSSTDVTEGSTTDTIDVVLTTQPATDVVLTVVSSDETSATVSAATLTFTNGNWDTPQTITVTAPEDVDAVSETPTVTIAVDDAASDDAYDAVSDSVVTVNVTDNDAGTVGFTVTESGGTTAITEGGATDSVDVVLDIQPAGDVVLTVVSSDETAMTVSAATLTFTNLDWDTPQTITATAPEDGDTVSETPTITFAVDDAASDDNFDPVADATVNVAVTDNDIGVAGITISESDGSTAVTEGSGTDSFTVVLDTQPTTDVVLDVTYTEQSAIGVSPTTLTFTNGNWDTPQTVTVTPTQDFDSESETSTITIAVNDASSDNAYDAVADVTVSVAVTDDDSAATPIPADITIESDQAGAQLGHSVAMVGDLNGDGYSDAAVGADQYDNGEADEGIVYVYYGSSAGISTTPSVTLEIDQAGALFGQSVSKAGDVNGDTYGDLIVGALHYTNGESQEGGAFIYYGSASGISTTPDVTLESNQASSEYGISVGSAGDVNNDGYDEVIVGAYRYDNGTFDEGAAFIYYGSASGVDTTVDVLLDSANQDSAFFGVTVAGAQNLNGDAYDDVIVGANLWDNDQLDEGAAFVYYGTASGTPTVADVVLEGNYTGTNIIPVNSAQDLNGDGYDDVVVGAQFYDNGETNEGRVFVYYGSASGVAAVPDVTLESNQAESNFGRAVIGAGDLDNDNYDDLIVGAYTYDLDQSNEGAVFVYYGSASGVTDTPDALVEGNQSDANFARSLGGAGNFNNDSYTDIIVGAQLYDNGEDSEGAAFVYYGSATGIAVHAAGSITVSESSGSTVATEGGATDSFTVVLTAQPTVDVVLTVTSSDTTAMTVSAATLTFTTSNWSTPQTITITAPQDADSDSESTTVTIAVNDAASDLRYDSTADSIVAVGVIDNDSSSSTPPSAGSGPTLPVRGQAGDLWADFVLGQQAFGEIAPFATTNQGLFLPHGVFVDRTNSSDNKMYVYDSGNNRILGYDVEDCLATGTNPLNCTPSLVIGQPDYTHSSCNGDGAFQDYPTRAAASAYTLCTQEEGALSPSESESGASMDVDVFGNLYVTDFYNHRVLKYNSPFTTDVIADQVWGQSDYTGVLCNRGGSAANNTLCFEWGNSNNWTAGVDIDATGNLWVVDSGNNRVLRFSNSGGVISSTADLVLGQSDFTSTGDGSGLAQLSDPNAVRVTAAGVVYVSDSNNNRVLRYTSPATGATGATFGSGFNRPHGLDFDPTESGRIWIMNRGDSTLELWDLTSATLIETVGEDGNGNILGDATGSVGIDSTGNIFVATGTGDYNNTVLMFEQGGSLTVPAERLYAPTPIGNVMSSSELGTVFGVEVSNNQLIVADEGRILFWNMPSGLSDLTTGKAADGYIGTSGINVRNPACCFELKADNANHLYTTTKTNGDDLRDIRIYNLPLTSGASPAYTIDFPLNLLGGGTVTDPNIFETFSGILPAPDGSYLWLSDSTTHRTFRIRNPLTSPVVDVILGQQNSTDVSCNQGGAVGDTTLCNPGGLAFDTFGNMYLADHYLENTGNYRLLRFNAGTFPTDNASVIYTQAPSHITTTVAAWTPSFDSYNRMVLGYNGYYTLVTSTMAPNGRQFPAVFNDPTASTLAADDYVRDYFPMGLFSTFDADNNLYMGDLNRSRLLIFKQPFGSASQTVTFVSPTGYTNNTNPVFSFKKSTDTPSGVSSYSVYVDSGKNRSFSTTGIPSQGNGTADYVWKDDSTVKIVFRNENDNDATNDQIDVYFKQIQSDGLTEGKHSWSVDIVSDSNSTVNRNQQFYIDTVDPISTSSSLGTIGDISGEYYSMSNLARKPVFTGSFKDNFAGSTKVNANGTRDTFESAASGPNRVTLTVKKLATGLSPSSSNATYVDVSSNSVDNLSVTTDGTSNKYASYTIQSPVTLADGWYQVTLVGRDGAGNEVTIQQLYLYYSVANSSSYLLTPGAGLLTSDETPPDTTESPTDEEAQTPAVESPLDTVQDLIDQGTTLLEPLREVLGGVVTFAQDTLEPVAPYAPAAMSVGAAAAFAVTAVGVSMGLAASSAAAAAGATVGSAATATTAAAAASAVASQTGFSWHLVVRVLQAMGLATRGQAQGIVFETSQFSPVPFALMTIRRENKKVGEPEIMETLVSDVHGVYRGARLEPGTYTMHVAHQDYSFPTTEKRQPYQAVHDFYKGEVYSISSASEEVLLTVPVDPMATQKAGIGFVGWVRRMVTRVNMKRLGLVFAAISWVMAAVHPSIINLAIAALYAAGVVWKFRALFALPAVKGVVVTPDGTGVEGVVVRLGNAAANQLAAVGITNKHGHFKLFAPKGLYQLLSSKVGFIPKESGLSFTEIDAAKRPKVSVVLQPATNLYQDLGLNI